VGVSDVGPRGQDPTQQLVVPELPAVQDVESLKAITGTVTCRLVDDEAVLQCKRCGRDARVQATPRRDFLAAVRAFVADHEECHG
jgi:hypothetical protein